MTHEGTRDAKFQLHKNTFPHLYDWSTATSPCDQEQFPTYAIFLTVDLNVPPAKQAPYNDPRRSYEQYKIIDWKSGTKFSLLAPLWVNRKIIRTQRIHSFYAHFFIKTSRNQLNTVLEISVVNYVHSLNAGNRSQVHENFGGTTRHHINAEKDTCRSSDSQADQIPHATRTANLELQHLPSISSEL